MQHDLCNRVDRHLKTCYYGLSMLKVLDKKYVQSTFLLFEDCGKLAVGGATNVFKITNTETGLLMGYVRWFNGWRRYAFFPVECILDHNSLVDIADFIKMKTKEQKEK